MDIMGLVGNLVTGAIGGNLSGAALKKMTLGTLGNTIAGAIGGAAGGYILQLVGVLSSAGLANMSWESVAAEGGITAVCGAVVTAVLGLIRGKTAGK